MVLFHLMLLLLLPAAVEARKKCAKGEGSSPYTSCGRLGCHPQSIFADTGASL